MTQNPEHLAKQLPQEARKGGLPPLDSWHPELSGDMDMRISRDGQWIYRGDPIRREALVRLFASILRREDDGEYYLVTPVEKWRIQVEDTPLLAHSLSVQGEGAEQKVSLVTNVGETLVVSDEHPLRVGSYPGRDEPRPVVLVRHGVEARLTTSAYYDLAEHLVEQTVDGQPAYGVFSCGSFYKVGQGG